MGPRPLERELGLEQGLRAVRIVRGVQGWGLIAGVVPLSEQPPVRRELIRHTANEPRLLVRGTGLRCVMSTRARSAALESGALWTPHPRGTRPLVLAEGTSLATA